MVKLLKRDVVVYLTENQALGEPDIFRTDGESQAEGLVSENERTVAQWVMRNNKHAGATTDTLSNAQCLYLAIRVNQNVYGVVGVAAKGNPLDSFEHSVLLSIFTWKEML